jgi:N-acetyl-gamma-glutamylphosphate reductase
VDHLVYYQDQHHQLQLEDHLQLYQDQRHQHQQELVDHQVEVAEAVDHQVKVAVVHVVAEEVETLGVELTVDL